MDLEAIMLSGINETEKDKYHTIPHMEFKKQNINEQRKKRQTKNQTLKYKEQTDGCQRGDRWWGGG